MVMLEYGKNETGTDLVGVYIKTNNCIRDVHYEMENQHTNHNINIFIKCVVFSSR